MSSRFLFCCGLCFITALFSAFLTVFHQSFVIFLPLLFLLNFSPIIQVSPVSHKLNIFYTTNNFTQTIHKPTIHFKLKNSHTQSKTSQNLFIFSSKFLVSSKKLHVRVPFRVNKKSKKHVFTLFIFSGYSEFFCPSIRI